MAVKKFPATIRAVFFDADGTLLEIENPYFSIAKKLDSLQESKALVRQYLSGDISYRQLAHRESELFVEKFKKKFACHPIKGDFEQFLPAVTIRTGAQKLVATLQKEGIDIFVLSTGVTDMISQLSRLGIPKDHLFANRFLFDSSEKYIGRDIIVSGEKKESFEKIALSYGLLLNEICYVGDNSFDKDLFDFLGDHGGLAILFDSGKKKEFRLRLGRNSHHIVNTETLEDVGQTIISGR